MITGIAGTVEMNGQPIGGYTTAWEMMAPWLPPTGDRFVEYGPEDEKWMRPLGLGSIIEDSQPIPVPTIRFEITFDQ